MVVVPGSPEVEETNQRALRLVGGGGACIVAIGGTGTTNESYNSLVVVVGAGGGRETTNESQDSLVVVVAWDVTGGGRGTGGGAWVAGGGRKTNQ